MWDAIGAAMRQAMESGMRAVEHRTFVAGLLQGTREAAVARLRERVRSFDDGAWAEFRACVAGMIGEAEIHLQQVRASDGSDAWGSSFEDRTALLMAQMQSGARPGNSAAVEQAEQMLAGLSTVLQYAEAFRAEAAAPPAPTPAQALRTAPGGAEEREIEALLDRFAETGNMPEGLMERLGRVKDPEVLGRLVEKLQALGAEDLGSGPTLDIAAHYVEGDEPYELLWPLAAELPLPFDDLDRKSRFHVLWVETTRRLLDAGVHRNGGRLDEAEAAFRECLERADQLGVPVLRSQAYEGLMSVEEKRGRRDAARRYLRLAEIERRRQAESAGGGGR